MIEQIFTCSAHMKCQVTCNTRGNFVIQVYMDSIGDLLWDQGSVTGAGGSVLGSRPKLEVKNGPFGSHLPGLTEMQVSGHN